MHEKAQQGSRRAEESGAAASCEITTVAFDRPWSWLAAGWVDLWHRPAVSLAYGFLVAGSGVLAIVGLAALGLEALFPVLAGGFLLVGPALAVGLYEKSRVLAAGGTPSLRGTVEAACRSLPRVGLLTALLVFVYLVWIRIAFMLLALFLGTSGLPPAREMMPMLLFSPNGLGLLVVGTAVGAGLAAVVYATTVIALPMLAERRVDVFTAMASSVQACLANPKPMLLWASLVAGFVLLGGVSLGIGLVVAFPLLGHATWHAYRDLVRPSAGAGGAELS